MRTPLTILLTFALGVASASAQFSRVKDKARNLDDKMTERHNAAENGAPAPGAPPKGAATPTVNTATAQPVAPMKPATQQQAATKLKADIAAARAKGEASAEAKKEFAQDLKLAVLGSSKPTPATLDSFAATFLPVVAGKNVTGVSDARLVQNIVVSLNCAGLSAARLTEIAGEVQTALTKAGAAEADSAKVVAELNQIIAQVQSGTGK